MKKGFDKEAFMNYLKEEFESVFNNHFIYELIDNLIEYAHKHEHVSKDQFIWFLADLIPEVEFGEIAQFAGDEMLTENGKAEKRKFINK